jgi:hypothetical protein
MGTVRCRSGENQSGGGKLIPIGFWATATQSGGHLAVNIPSNLVLMLIPGTSILSAWMTYLGSKQLKNTHEPHIRKRIRRYLIIAAFLAYVCFMPAHVELDAPTNTAKIFTWWLYPRWRTVPLEDVTSADIKQVDFAEAIVLSVGDGTIQLTPYQQLPGTEKVTNEINQFLREGGQHLQRNY